MVKTASDAAKTASSQKKQLKKQAKREAKLQAKLEQARQGVQKTEKKIAKVQSKLADAQTHVHDLEEQLSQLQSARQSLNGTPAVSDTDQQNDLQPLDAQVAEAEAPTAQEEAIEELHEESLPPAEGRADVPADQPAATENQEIPAEPAEEQESIVVLTTEEALSETITPPEESLTSDEQAVATDEATEAVSDEQSTDNASTGEEAPAEANKSSEEKPEEASDATTVS